MENTDRAELAQLRDLLAKQEELFSRRLTRLERRPLYSSRVPFLAICLFMSLLPLSLLAAGPFNDLNPDSPHNDNIQAIADAGITRGCDPGVAYCPNGLVTREEMASFLARVAGLGDNPAVVNAKTAQNATSAAQLNGQPASYYQPAGQPIANATNASNLGGQPASAYALRSEVNSQGASTFEFSPYGAFALGVRGEVLEIERFHAEEIRPAELPDGQYIEAELRVSLASPVFVILPLTLPSVWNDSSVKIRTVSACFSYEGSNTQIGRIALMMVKGSSISSPIDNTNPRGATPLACYTFDAPTPVPISGALTLQFRMESSSLDPQWSILRLYGVSVTVE